jgi:hypothetical protein
MKRKGMNYDVGSELSGFVSRPHLETEVVHRELEIIKRDLHCNAVRISGLDISRLMVTAEDALKQGLEVWLSPQMTEQGEQETLDYIVQCATAAERVRQSWPHLVFILGCELTLFMQGILEGQTLFDRLANPAFLEQIKSGRHNKPLNAFLASANKAVRQVFGGQVTYASAMLEAVDWSLFDFVCLDYYRDHRIKGAFVERLKPYLTHGKPVLITEVGCCTYQGAEDAGGMGWAIVDYSTNPPKQLKGTYVRDEALQARELTEVLGLLEGTGGEGAFVFTFVSPVATWNADPRYDLDMASYSLVKSYADRYGTTYPDMPWEPKASFKAVANYFATH